MQIRSAAVLLPLLLLSPGRAQTDIYKPYKNTSLWKADTPYVGVGKGGWFLEPPPETKQPKYTGPNHADDKYYSTASSDANVNAGFRFQKQAKRREYLW